MNKDVNPLSGKLVRVSFMLTSLTKVSLILMFSRTPIGIIEYIQFFIFSLLVLVALALGKNWYVTLYRDAKANQMSDGELLAYFVLVFCIHEMVFNSLTIVFTFLGRIPLDNLTVGMFFPMTVGFLFMSTRIVRNKQ